MVSSTSLAYTHYNVLGVDPKSSPNSFTSNHDTILTRSRLRNRLVLKLSQKTHSA